jgi:hypothetical protein
MNGVKTPKCTHLLGLRWPTTNMTEDPYALCPVCCKENDEWTRDQGSRKSIPMVCVTCMSKRWKSSPGLSHGQMIPIPLSELFDER